MSILVKHVQKKTSLRKTVFKKQANTKKAVKQSLPVRDILSLQKSIGNQAVQKLFEYGSLQKILSVGDAMQMPKPKLQKQEENEETKKETVQTETKEKPVSINGAYNLFKPSIEHSSKDKNTSVNPPKEKKKPAVPVPSAVKESSQETQVNDAEEASKKTEKTKTPTNPHEDKAFQATIKQIKRTGKIQKAHPSPKNKLAEVKNASYLPKEEQQKNLDETDHFETIKQIAENTKQKKFTPDTFKALLKKDLDNLENSLPHDKEGAENFKNSKPLKSVKEHISSNVEKEKENIAGPLAKDAKVKNPPRSSTVPTIAKPVPKASVGRAPRPINKRAVAPKPLNKTEVSMEKESRSLDDLMQENDLNESQLANSNEPAFLKALNTKRKAQKAAKQAPMIYRGQESKILANARHQAAVSGKKGLHAMFSSRVHTFGNVFQEQISTEKADKNEQKKINAEFEKIYNRTKKNVADKLNEISTKVNSYFADGGLVDKAKKTFEKNVEDKLDEIISWTDIFFGKDTKAIEKVFVTEKNKFITTLNIVFDKIAVTISDGLNEAIKIIDDGRKETKNYYDGLNKEQKKLAKDALDTFNDKYDTLEESVNAKEKELAQDLARQYQKNANSLRKTFEGIKKKVSASWLDGAINAIKGVIETVKKLKKLISTLLTEIQAFVPKIMADPVGFAKKLFGGIKEGIGLFKANIKKHLIGGFVKWLTGAMGPMGITIPDNIFSLKGIFSLVMQILGLGWDYLRRKAVKMLGEPIVKAMETGVKIFRIIRTKGIVGIWEYLKQKFNDLKETVIGAIQEMLITKVIVAGIKWLVSLLIPGAGFIKAVLAIKDIVVFFVESAIMLIPTLIKSIRALASGNVKMIAKAVEKGLSLLVSLVINLFAKLIGLGGLAKKVMGIIKRIRKRIDKAIDKLILKARKTFKGVIGKGKKPNKLSKDKNQYRSDEKLSKGLAALDAVTTRYAKNGATYDEMITGVKSVRRKYKVFKSISVIKKHGYWYYIYKASPEKEKKAARIIEAVKQIKHDTFYGKMILRKTTDTFYLVRAGGKKSHIFGGYGDHIFDEKSEAVRHAKYLASLTINQIRQQSGLPVKWPPDKKTGDIKEGNPVEVVYVLEGKGEYMYVQGVVAPQPETGKIFVTKKIIEDFNKTLKNLRKAESKLRESEKYGNRQKIKKAEQVFNIWKEKYKNLSKTLSGKGPQVQVLGRPKYKIVDQFPITGTSKTKTSEFAISQTQEGKKELSFKANDHKQHKLLIGKKEIIIKSTPEKFSTFLEEHLAKNDKEKQEAVKSAFSTYKKWRTEENKSKKNQDQTKLNNYENELVTYSKILYGIEKEEDIPDTKVFYENVNELGLGEKMNAKQLTKKGNKGTQPTVSNPIYKILNQRRKGGGSYYVKGHLLSEKLHGSGKLFKNLTPLSRKGNRNHEKEIENILKLIVTTGGIVRYMVDPVYKKRGLNIPEDSPNKFPDKFSDEEWEMLKEIRKTEDVAVPKYMRIKAFLLEKKKKDIYQKKKDIYTGIIKNPIEKNLEKYEVINKGTIRKPFYLRQKTAEEIASLNGINQKQAKLIFDKLKKGETIQYKRIIGIIRKVLEEKNPEYRIIQTH